MKIFLETVRAEARKQFKSKFHSSAMIFTMILWPFLNIFAVYYSYKPFEQVQVNSVVQNLIGENRVFTFILLGYLSYMFFSTFIHSAWDFSNERIQGTLEMIFLSPANRYGVLLGNALSSLIESIWLFSTFAVAALVIFSDLTLSSYWMLIIAVLVLLIPSISWGVFLNSIFLFARDTRTIFSLLYQPLELLSGVKFPIFALPYFIKVIGYVFPLTWSLIIVREIFMNGATFTDIRFSLLILSIISVLLIFVSMFILWLGEKKIMKSGDFNLF